MDRHGQVRWRFRRKGLDTYIPGPYASAEFRSAYEAAVAGAKTLSRSTAALGTFACLIEAHLGSFRFKSPSDSRKRTIRGELD